MAPNKELERTKSEPSFASGRGTAALAAQFRRCGAIVRTCDMRLAWPRLLFFEAMPASHLDFLERLSPYDRGPDCICAHGGLDSRDAGVWSTSGGRPGSRERTASPTITVVPTRSSMDTGTMRSWTVVAGPHRRSSGRQSESTRSATASSRPCGYPMADCFEVQRYRESCRRDV